MGALALVLIAGSAQAQNARQNRGQHKQQIEQLNLSAEQKAKLEAFGAEQKKAMAELKEKNGEAAKQQRQELHRKFREQRMAVFTPEQKQKLQQLRADHRKAAKDNMQERRKAVKEQLALTQAQQEKIKGLNQEFRTKRKALHGNTTLDESKRKEEIKALAQQHRKDLRQVLTPEQQQKLQALRKEQRNRAGK